jgi:hypothetical protein
MFPNILEDLSYKWYMIEEVRENTWNWKNLKEDFMKYFSFVPGELGLENKFNKYNNP